MNRQNINRGSIFLNDSISYVLKALKDKLVLGGQVVKSYTACLVHMVRVNSIIFDAS